MTEMLERYIELYCSADYCQHRFSAGFGPNREFETGESILLNGTFIDEEERSQFHNSAFSITALRGRLNATITFYADLKGPPTPTMQQNYPPVMGHFILPEETFSNLVLQVQRIRKKGNLQFTLWLPVAEELYRDAAVNVPSTPEAPIPLKALKLSKTITIRGCERFEYNGFFL